MTDTTSPRPPPISNVHFGLVRKCRWLHSSRWHHHDGWRPSFTAGNRSAIDMPRPTSLARSISPPPSRRPSTAATPVRSQKQSSTTANVRDVASNGVEPTLAAIEAGKAAIENHLDHFAKHLAKARRPYSTVGPRISIDDFRALYERNQHDHGRHFVIHQHDHPISGVHYDLRLQFSASSTVSFAIPYGLPGNPNSIRPNRMAIETRVHNLWNNLIEAASHATGSLLIWDTGEYEILPYKQQDQRMTDDEVSDDEDAPPEDIRTHSERLSEAFRDRHVRLRLHGSRLPSNYTVSLRLPRRNDRISQPREPKRKRRRLDPARAARARKTADTDSSASEEFGNSSEPHQEVPHDEHADDDMAANASDEGASEDATIRANNAYTGSINTIGSIHQRHWFLALDKRNSGFVKVPGGPDRHRWIGEGKAFFVHGRDVETSVVTGRCADEVMMDEGVQKFVGRKLWRPILE